MIVPEFAWQFEDFVIIKSSFSVTDAQTKRGKNTSSDKYPIDFNYAFKKEGDYIFLFVKISINQTDEPTAGYQIFVEGVGVLKASIIQSLIESNDQMWEFSVLSYCVNQLRNYIMSLTSMGSLDKYTLPLLDLSPIILSKKSDSINLPKQTPVAKQKSVKVKKRKKTR